MPPKPKFTREEIITAAYRIARSEGMEAVTANSLKTALGTSASPLFTLFPSMEAIRRQVKEQAAAVFADYLRAADQFTPAYKMRGMQMVQFARQEPRLFRLLFMQEEEPMGLDSLMEQRIVGFAEDIDGIVEEFHLPREEAANLFRQLWIHTYGICVLCATGVCTFSDREIMTLLTETFAGMVMLLQSGQIGICRNLPETEKRTHGE